MKNAKVGDIVCYGDPKANGSVKWRHVAFYLGRTENNGKWADTVQMGGGKDKVWKGVYKRKFLKIVRVNGSN